jgi:polyisoprenoid-binding protein YceI
MEMRTHSMSVAGTVRGSLRFFLWGLLWGLAGCQTSPPPATTAPPAANAAPAPVPAGAREYKVMAKESLLQILVYRGGAMAKLGHNHVIASHDLAGSVFVAKDPLATSFDIHVPVNELTVDEPTLRAAAGTDFPGAVPQNARDGTRVNLLSVALLDGANHPDIRLRATGFKETGEGYEAGIEVTLKGATCLLHVPVSVARDGATLTARGEFPLKQSELGLKPFSVAMGTLVVLDEMRVRFTVVARSE